MHILPFCFIFSGSLQGRVQFIVRSQANSNLVNILMDTISLSPGDTLSNISLPALLRASIRSDVIFTVSFSLDCEEHYYGPNCIVYCRPSDSDELATTAASAMAASSACRTTRMRTPTAQSTWLKKMVIYNNTS